MASLRPCQALDCQSPDAPRLTGALTLNTPVCCAVQGLTTPSGSIYVKVTDNCPCVQYDVTTGAETGVNSPCCGDVNHFDLSYFAFEKLAHPVRPTPAPRPATIRCLSSFHRASEPLQQGMHLPPLQAGLLLTSSLR